MKTTLKMSQDGIIQPLLYMPRADDQNYIDLISHLFPAMRRYSVVDAEDLVILSNLMLLDIF